MENNKEKKFRAWHRKNIHLVNKENDIKFRGPLSYRHLRMIGWALLAVSQIANILRLGEKLYNTPGWYQAWPDILSNCFSLMGPLFLIAIFSIVLNAKDGFKRLLITYSGLAIGIYLVFILVYEHYLVGLFTPVTDQQTAHTTAALLITSMGKHGFFAFNMFVDLLLCTLVTFFINYNPTKYFQGKKIYIFRALVVLPILYEIGAIVLKAVTSEGIIELSPYFFPLLTTKTPIAFLIFVTMAIFVKNRRKFFLKKGKTEEEYAEFEKTNVNSLHFSLFLVMIIVVVVILDIFIAIGLGAVLFMRGVPAGVAETDFLAYCISKVQSWGFGNSFVMLLIIPIVIFFDYKKTHEDKLVDLILPVAGIAAVAVVYVEGGYEVIRFWLAEKIKSFSGDGGGTDPAPLAPIAPLVEAVKSIIKRG